MQNLPGLLEMDGWNSASKTLGIDSAMENSRVASPLQKVWAILKTRKPPVPWEHPRDLARALLWAAQSRAHVLSMTCLYLGHLLTPAQCDPREKSGYKSKGTGERKEQK